MSIRRAVAVGAALALTSVALSIVAGVGRSDDMWFLQVVTRAADGDVLYRDVFFGSTPLAVWTLLPAVAVIGSELIVLKVVIAGALAATGVALLIGAHRAGLSWTSAGALAVLVTTIAARLIIPFYIVLAMMFAAWAVVAAAASLRSGSQRTLLAAGALAGASAASKYTIGLLVVVAIGAIVLARRRNGRDVLVLGVPFVAVVVAALVPVVATGGWDRFVEYGVTAKGTYVHAGAYSYLQTLRDSTAALREVATSPSLQALRHARSGLVNLIPAAALLSLLAAWCAAPERRSLLAANAVLGVAAFAGAHPRYDTIHLVAALPGTALLLAVSMAVLVKRWRPLRRTALLLVGGWTAANLVGGLLPRDSDARLSGVRHIRGVLAGRQDLAEWKRDASALRAAAAAGPVMVVARDAGMRYLLSGVDDPTPFDYPYATSFGKRGEAETAVRIRSGDIAAVCLDEKIPVEFRPREVEYAVRQALTARGPIGTCTLYTR